MPAQAIQKTGPAGLFSTGLIALAAGGWLVLIANLFGLAEASGWIFPKVEDLPGLAASSLLLAMAGFTPFLFRKMSSTRRSAP